MKKYEFWENKAQHQIITILFLLVCKRIGNQNTNGDFQTWQTNSTLEEHMTEISKNNFEIKSKK